VEDWEAVRNIQEHLMVYITQIVCCYRESGAWHVFQIMFAHFIALINVTFCSSTCLYRTKTANLCHQLLSVDFLRAVSFIYARVRR
jgi:hypothetical protein